jgi:hypothetical protein
MGFYVYVIFLVASGVMLLGMGCARAPYARRRRALNLIIGAGLAGYGLYLLLFFQSGHYFLFFYAFILPVLLAVRFFRERAAYRASNPAAYPGATGHGWPAAGSKVPPGFGATAGPLPYPGPGQYRPTQYQPTQYQP